jgi:hypothetical protein
LGGAVGLMADLREGAMKSADKGCDANAVRGTVRDKKVWIDGPLEAKRRPSLVDMRHLLPAVEFLMLTVNKLLFYRKNLSESRVPPK